MSELLTYLTDNDDNFRRARLAALYSDFRHLRTINPDGYNANIEAWRRGLENAAKTGHVSSGSLSKDLLSINVDENLLSALETKEWGRPLALGTVIRDAIARKDLIPIQEFLTSQENIYNKSWSITPWHIISWGVRHLGLGGGQHGKDKLPVGKLVVRSNIEGAAKGVIQQASIETTWVGRVYSRELFSRKFKRALDSGQPMSETDIDVLLKHLERDKNAVTYDGHTVKFKGLREMASSEITPEDTTIASLKTLLEALELQVTMLDKKIESLSNAARGAVMKKNKAVALAALRSKKLAESSYSKQSAVLHQLEEVYIKIGEAADQVEVVRIMEGSTGVLKTLNKRVGGIERVDRVVDELKEEIFRVDEINSVIAEAGQTACVIDESELEDELEAMERTELTKRREVEKLANAQKEREEVVESRRRLDQLPSVEGGDIKNSSPVEDEQMGITKITKSAAAMEDTTQELQRMSL